MDIAETKRSGGRQTDVRLIQPRLQLTKDQVRLRQQSDEVSFQAPVLKSANAPRLHADLQVAPVLKLVEISTEMNRFDDPSGRLRFQGLDNPLVQFVERDFQLEIFLP